MQAETEGEAPTRRAPRRADSSPRPPPDWRAGLSESLPLWCAAALFVVLGVYSADRGLTVGPGRVHLALLLYALAAVSGIGAILAWLSATEDEPEEGPSGPSGPPRRDDLGRPFPVVSRFSVRGGTLPVWSEESEPSIRAKDVLLQAPHPPSEEVHSALRELDAIEDELDERPNVRRTGHVSQG